MKYLKKSLSLKTLLFCLLLGSFAFGKEQACEGSKPVNIVIIADAFEEEMALRDYQLKETMQKRRYLKMLWIKHQPAAAS